MGIDDAFPRSSERTILFYRVQARIDLRLRAAGGRPIFDRPLFGGDKIGDAGHTSQSGKTLFIVPRGGRH